MPRVHPLIKQKKNKEKSISQSGYQILTQLSPSFSTFSYQTTDQNTPQLKLNESDSQKKLKNNYPNLYESLINLYHNVKSVNENIIESQQSQFNQKGNSVKFGFSIDILAAIEKQLFQLKENIQKYQDDDQKDQPSSFNLNFSTEHNQFLQQQCNGQIISSTNFQQQKSSVQKIENNISIQPICQNDNFKSLYIQQTKELNQIQSQLEEEIKQNEKLQDDFKQLELFLGGQKQQLIESQKNQKNLKEENNKDIIKMKQNNYNFKLFEDQCDVNNIDSAVKVLIQVKDQEYQLLQNKYNDLNNNYLENQHSLQVVSKDLQKKNTLLDEKNQEIEEWKLKYKNLNKQILVMPNYSIELRYSNQKISDLEKRIRELVEQNEKYKMQNINLEIENKKYIEVRNQYEQLSKDYIQMKQDIIVLKAIQKQFQDFLSENQKENDRLYSNDYLFSLASSTNRNLNTSSKDHNIQEDQIIEVCNQNNSDFKEISQEGQTQNSLNSKQNFRESYQIENKNYQLVIKTNNQSSEGSQSFSNNLNQQDYLKDKVNTKDNEIDNYISQLQQQLQEYKQKLLHLQENQPNNRINEESNTEHCFNQVVQIEGQQGENLIVNLNDQISQLEIILKEKNNLLEQSFNEKMQMLSELTQIKEREKLLMKGNENLQQMYLQIRSEFESSCINDKANSEKIEFYEQNLQKLQAQYEEILQKYQEILQKQELSKQISFEKNENPDFENQQVYVQSIEFSNQNQTQVSKAVQLCINKNIQDDSDLNQDEGEKFVQNERESQEQITLIESESIIQSKDLKNTVSDQEQLKQSENQKSIYLESQIQQLKSIVKNGRNEIEQLYQVLSQRKNENDQLQLQINQKDLENEKLNQKIQVLILEIEQQQKQSKQLSQDIQELTKLKNKFQQQADRYFLEAVKKNKELIEATEICNVIQAKYEDALQNIKDLESRMVLPTETLQNS
ncbi:hypothetical protein TTHERM_00145670 (macronuclear) [Tetrahymena thermophila SB210]|uniref:Uncharacterized protein n=1 Tax=Tetrahymena thermophila (strain SB210) TaxID=312017 RepID=I7LUB4_TETTS|nr:hypothetical protein TTHERM_00145670 [Tetrahymena thermophila SB210]EAR90962.3 hypothetical protein TTHERM_00145670 [Tetrahymena thermophila SB210]|eukprot:XP_001011207.3 hypothetical protein TTHERM_00145670 [Tetrahymena thermophila SB210]